MTPDRYFATVLGTVCVVRLGLLVSPTPSPTVRGFRIHHWMTGIAVMIVGAVAHSSMTHAIGLGLFVDELPYVLWRGKTHADNYSWWSLCGVAALLVAIFFFRDVLAW